MTIGGRSLVNACCRCSSRRRHGQSVGDGLGDGTGLAREHREVINVEHPNVEVAAEPGSQTIGSCVANGADMVPCRGRAYEHDRNVKCRR